MRNIIITAGIICLFSCKEKKPATTEQQTVVQTNTIELTPEQMKSAGIKIEKAATRDMHTILKVNGMIDVPPQNIVSVSIPLGGYLKSMRLLPGMQVSKGQVLAILEDPQYIQLQQDYLVAKSRLAYLESDYTRQKGLNEAQANSDKLFQQVKSDFESQKVILRSLGERLQLISISPDKLNESNISRSISIHAPISGFVTKVNVNIGKYVSPTDVLFELIDPSDLHLSLTVFEKDVINLEPGQKVICYANNNEKYTARIHLITRNINENHSSEVHCHFDKYDKRLLPGMFMNAEIELNNAHVKAVPEEAVVKWENKTYIFFAEGTGKFEMTPVETGSSNDGYIEIKTAIPDKDIVTGNAYALLMKMKNGGEDE
ncbi:efflux RND transporter periplasmic adaptor subunit [Chitinophaga oryziterrae]|uniref:Efflux RND transporter periplasmic adaptor subunit n=1 Tax=Chitinophaga oryziterrae TaxID=1031224 RepID=A0A6N8J510_9BACT|nr:efflux RND transporter periplasmic adaptor subunit [Chitinophaga oryziterrae]MVT40317.1 efflux RND transporter periplasmic adaptor subunit [Chitinophaga oryziterrae]